jgi:hypothetical protein
MEQSPSWECNSKVKFSLYRPWRSLVLRAVEAPTFSDIRLRNGGKIVSPTRRPFFTPRKISIRGWVDPRGIVRLEGLGKLKKSTSSWTRTGDLPACSIVPQPTTLPRAAENLIILHEIRMFVTVFTRAPSLLCALSPINPSHMFH